jgi:nucleoside-diphosphate-sugar epimerase
MKDIDKSKPVLVTGANGFVAAWLVKKLLDEGMTVHAAVRDASNNKKVAHLKELADNSKGSIVFFNADLLKPGSYREAMQGCELIYHTASPFISDVRNPEEELIKPALNGTENVLNTANETASVKRVVLTSSCAAMYTDAIDTHRTPKGMLNEEVWNTTASMDYQPYSLSKTLAEKRAWEIASAQDRWDLICINPCLVVGPSLNPKNITSETFNILKTLGNGDMKMGAPRIGVGIVDVRDVAEAHFKAGFTPHAKGRYITAAHSTNFLEMGLVLHEKFADRYPLPKNALPKWLVWLIGPVLNKTLSRKFISGNVNISWKADNSKIKSELGMQFRPLKTTMEDAFEQMHQEGLITK